MIAPTFFFFQLFAELFKDFTRYFFKIFVTGLPKVAERFQKMLKVDESHCISRLTLIL